MSAKTPEGVTGPAPVQEVAPQQPAFANTMQEDPLYQSIREETGSEHKRQVYGTDDLTQLSPDQIAVGANSSRALEQNLDKEAEAKFKAQQPERFKEYEAREKTRVYTNEQQEVDPSQDPAYQKVQEAIKGVHFADRDMSDLELRKKNEYAVNKFLHDHPEKAKAYAEVDPDLAKYIKQQEDFSARYQWNGSRYEERVQPSQNEGMQMTPPVFEASERFVSFAEQEQVQQRGQESAERLADVRKRLFGEQSAVSEENSSYEGTQESVGEVNAMPAQEQELFKRYEEAFSPQITEQMRINSIEFKNAKREQFIQRILELLWQRMKEPDFEMTPEVLDELIAMERNSPEFQ